MDQLELVAGNYNSSKAAHKHASLSLHNDVASQEWHWCTACSGSTGKICQLKVHVVLSIDVVTTGSISALGVLACYSPCFRAGNLMYPMRLVNVRRLSFCLGLSANALELLLFKSHKLGSEAPPVDSVLCP